MDIARKGARRRTKADGYVGPTKAGLWMTIPQALAIADAISAAVDASELFANDERRDLN